MGSISTQRHDTVDVRKIKILPIIKGRTGDLLGGRCRHEQLDDTVVALLIGGRKRNLVHRSLLLLHGEDGPASPRQIVRGIRTGYRIFFVWYHVYPCVLSSRNLAREESTWTFAGPHNENRNVPTFHAVLFRYFFELPFELSVFLDEALSPPTFLAAIVKGIVFPIVHAFADGGMDSVTR